MNTVAVEMEFESTEGLSAPTLLKQQVGERLTAHRLRRAQMIAEGGIKVSETADGSRAAGAPSRSQQIALAVAERYASSPSYHAFLAAEAEEATRRARAVAEVAMRTAQAVAAAQRELMEELAAVASRQGMLDSEDAICEASGERDMPVTAVSDEPRAPVANGSRAGLSVRLFEDAGRLSQRGGVVMETIGRSGGASVFEDPEQARALDEEIMFRQSPTFELERPSVAIPGNLLEFPRQLIAARKARPRYAEGPLMAEGGQDGTQLRIFEVEAEQMATTPPVETSAAEWSSIWLDALAANPHDEPANEATAKVVAAPLEPASVERRVMAALVDGCLVMAAYVGLATMFAYRVTVLPGIGLAAGASVGLIVGLFAIYLILFFTLSEATPGMRYARIALCTFDDENPTRAAMRRRTLALLIAGCPVGLGFLWALVDDDRLGWHDRISRMYQRGY